MDSTDLDDWALVRNGDTRALGRMFELHADRLFRHAARLVSNREDAKDVVVMAFFELWRKRESVRLVDGSPLPWLVKTVGYVARNQERSAARYRRVLSRVPLEAAAQPPCDQLDESGVGDAVRRLPSKERDVVILSVIEGLEDRDTATALGIPVGTVKSRLSRAKARLRIDLAELREG